MTTIIVQGEPVGQGSTRSFERDGRTFTTHGNAGRLGRWRGDVRTEAVKAWGDQPRLDTVPVEIVMAFVFERPKSHLRTNGELRPTAALYPRADIDKLERAILDALTGIVFKDDSQVVSVSKVKGYGSRAGVTIDVQRALP